MSGFNVSLQVALSIGTVGTEWALEWLDSCVYLHVSLQVRLAVPTMEPLATDGTDELAPH